MENLTQGYIQIGENLEVLKHLPDVYANLIYIDPPFNTGKTQARTQIEVTRDQDGDRVGFQGARYSSTIIGTKAYLDHFDDYLAFLRPRLEEAYRVLADNGTLYFHIDYREVHYCKLLLDQIFGRENFINEIIWAYDYGGRPKNRWPAKHDNILMYVKDRKDYTFNTQDIDRIPYMAPGLVGKEKANKGKLPTDTWWHTIVSPTGKEKTGYPTQKPLGILKRIISASSHPGDMVLDFFAGSGTTGEAALESGRKFHLVDDNPEAGEVMRSRFAGKPVEFIDPENTKHGVIIMSSNSKKVYELGQSIWYDNIQRRLLVNGELQGMINRGEIYGVTSNPSIFNNAIAKSNDYDSALLPLAKDGKSAMEIYESLVIADIRQTADLFSDVYESTEGGDGFVSLEVDPDLANNTKETISEAKRLWDLVDRPNLMIKIPATKEGIPAVTEAIAEGINVNVTLIFSQERYEAVMDAYLAGLKKRVKAGQAVDRIASVASFFVSRVDTNVDGKLVAKMEAGGLSREAGEMLLGKAAVANAKLAYQRFRKVFEGQRYLDLKNKGARLQRPLWASTSTKNPGYPDVLYVDNLIGPHTVNTIPPATLVAFNDHGNVELSLEDGVHDAEQVFNDLTASGISIDQVTEELEVAGVKAFSDAFHALLGTIESRRQVES